MPILPDSYRDEVTFYTGRRVAAIAGANGVIGASNGPYLVWSPDDGNQFGGWHSWDDVWESDEQYSLDFETGKIHSCFPPVDVVELNRDNFLITDLVISSVDGPTGGDVTFILLTTEFNGKYIGPAHKQIVVEDMAGIVVVPVYGLSLIHI